MRNRAKFLFYFLLVILVASRVIKIINTPYFIDTAAKYNLFISTHIANGIFPSPFLFQINTPYAGGGHFLYSITAVPFILLFGKSYFSLRLASIIFLILTYLLLYKFCNKYFDSKIAIFASFLFVITPGMLTAHSGAGEGRHFHLNLFFILSLYLFSKIKEKKRILNYLLFGITCGLGVYFYPAFLVTFFVFGLFLLLDIDIKSPSFIYKYAIVIICVIIAGNFLEFGSPWYRNFYNVATLPRKNIIISGNIFSIPARFILLFFKITPNVFAFSKGHFSELFTQPLRSYFYNLTTLSRISLEMLRLVFITSCVSLCWINKGNLKKIICNAFSLTRKHAIPIRKYITIFLLVHLFIYIFIFCFNEREMHNYKYYLPLFLNIILLIVIFLSEAWKKNRYISIFLLIFALSPGIIYQYHNFTTASMKDFYKHYIYFYEEKDTIELLVKKPISVHKLMCDKLNINVCHTAGAYYADTKNVDSIQKDFEYLSSDNINKLRYLYQGYINGDFLKLNGDIKEVLSIIEKIDKKYWKFCYVGLGEGLVKLIYNPRSNSDKYTHEEEFDFQRDKKMIKKISSFVRDDYKRYFFQGVGEGLAKEFAKPYSPYITDDGFYDVKIVDSYLKMIDEKEYRKVFLAGFHNKDIWTKF